MSTVKVRFCIDRGGTFTDVYAEASNSDTPIVMKLLSRDPEHYDDAPREAIRRILSQATGIDIPKGTPVPTENIEFIRMGTTVATNALLERTGPPVTVLLTKGFRDVLRIGTQARRHIFDLTAQKPHVPYDCAVEIDERVRVLQDGLDLGEDGLPIAERCDLSKCVKTSCGTWVEVLQAPDLCAVREQLMAVKEQGVESVAIVLMHAHVFPDHEELIRKIAVEDVGIKHCSVSSRLMPMAKYTNRGNTTVVNAYLTPVLSEYLEQFCRGFHNNLQDDVPVLFMQSDGGLTSADAFHGFRAILSGPAGGVVGHSKTAMESFGADVRVMGFDMGGTSTDVSRFAGSLEHTMETETAGVLVQAPQLDIATVAAGGGSVLKFHNGLYCVGPESSGAFPGPTCYGKDGPLCVTDANAVLGRLLPEYFPKVFGHAQNEPLNVAASRAKFEALAKKIGGDISVEEAACGFIRVANEAMARPIRVMAETRGFSPSQHILNCFGGAGGQHACEIATILGIERVFIHRYAGILSAYGMKLSDIVEDVQDTFGAQQLNKTTIVVMKTALEGLAMRGADALCSRGVPGPFQYEYIIALRFEGTGTNLHVPIELSMSLEDVQKRFLERYDVEYGFTMPGRALILDDVRVRVVFNEHSAASSLLPREKAATAKSTPSSPPVPIATTQTFFEQRGWETDVCVFRLEDLLPGHTIQGPAIILQNTSTIVLDPSASIEILIGGHILMKTCAKPQRMTTELNPIYLSVMSHRFMSIAEQMGRALQRTSISTNIKERLDFSCAIFGPEGGLVANAPHIPVHLGAMGAAVRFQQKLFADDWKQGDVVVTNHPVAGGSHLPDITVISCYFVDGKPAFYVAARGHHADIGGAVPGSMPPFSKFLSDEGAQIKGMKLVKEGVFQDDAIRSVLTSAGCRTLEDDLADLKAQVAANTKGIRLVRDLIEECGMGAVVAYMKYVQDNAENAVRMKLREVAEEHGTVLTASDYMDDGTLIHLQVTIDPTEGRAEFDWTKSGTQVLGNTNCPNAVVSSAVLYSLRCIVKDDIPLNQGCLVPITIRTRPSSILQPSEECAVVGGNVLTSQRITDVILRSFHAAADSQGCMNNFTFGNSKFGYYETIAGGAGAGPSWHGASAVHTHMTNTRITDPEIMELRYPVLVSEFSIRADGSGGGGLFHGGEGVHREILFLQDDLEVSLLCERRSHAPKGLDGGENGKRGENILFPSGSVSVSSSSSSSVQTAFAGYRQRRAQEELTSLTSLLSSPSKSFSLGGKTQVKVCLGDCIRILTPGGGGYGVKK